jgi:hypothetical protein
LTSTIKIGIAGTHSTGKSTFVRLLQQRLEAAGLSSATVSDLAVEARNAGFPILREHTFESTAWIVTRCMTLELEAGLKFRIVIVDRPVPDALGYLRAALESRNSTIDVGQRTYLEELVKLHAKSYDQLLVTTIDPSIPIDTSEERDLDPVFRNMAASGIAAVFDTLKLPYKALPALGREAVADSIVQDLIGRLQGAGG